MAATLHRPLNKVFMYILGREWALRLVWKGGGTQRFDPNHWRQWDNSQVDPEILNIIDKSELDYWLRKFVVKVRNKKDPGNICCNTLEQFSTLSRFSWIFWKINFNFRLQLCWKLSLYWSRGEILWRQKQFDCNENFYENSSSLIFFSFWVCLCKIPQLRKLFVKKLYR